MRTGTTRLRRRGLLRPTGTHSSGLAQNCKGPYLGDGGNPLTHFEAVGQYLKRRATDTACRDRKVWTNGRRGTAESQYGDGMAMDRYLLTTYENPILTILSLRISPLPQNRLTLLHGLADRIDAVLYKIGIDSKKRLTRRSRR